MRSSVSGIQIPTAARLNIDGEFTLDAAAGTSGQLLISQGAGNTPTWTSSPNLNNPLLSSISTVGGGGNEGGQVNFARVTDGNAYWYIDSYGATSTPSLRFVENTTVQLTLASGGIATYAGAVKLRSGSTAVDAAPLYFGNTSPSLLTTPVQGAVEYDGISFYGTPNSASRGRIPASQYYLIGTAYTTDWSTTNAIPALANKRLTVVPGIYEFEGSFFITTPGGPTSNYGSTFRFVYTTVTGTNAVNNIGYEYMLSGNSTTNYSTASTPTILYQTTVGATNNITTAVTTATKYAIVKVKGTVRISGTGTGTFAPAVAITAIDSANSVNAVTINAGSWFRISPAATYSATADVSVGAWA